MNFLVKQSRSGRILKIFWLFKTAREFNYHFLFYFFNLFNWSSFKYHSSIRSLMTFRAMTGWKQRIVIFIFVQHHSTFVLDFAARFLRLRLPKPRIVSDSSASARGDDLHAWQYWDRHRFMNTKFEVISQQLSDSLEFPLNKPNRFEC